MAVVKESTDGRGSGVGMPAGPMAPTRGASARERTRCVGRRDLLSDLAPSTCEAGVGAVLAFTDITERLASEKAVRERDAAEIRAAESQAAQRRILESATVARHQRPRDLHDGARQRLVTLVLGLQLARDQIRCPREDRSLLNNAMEQAGALDELRELAAGIRPLILSSRGLCAAVKALARRSALPVDCFRSHTRPTARGRRDQCVFPDS